MKYRYWLCLFGGSFTSNDYDSALACLEDFCKALRNSKDCYWGQFIEIDRQGRTEVKLAIEGEKEQ